MCASFVSGIGVGGKKATRRREVHFVITKAAVPPSRPSSRLSIKNWRMICWREAPIPSRMAISRRRPTERTNRRLATLAQASRSRTPASPSNIGRILYEISLDPLWRSPFGINGYLYKILPMLPQQHRKNLVKITVNTKGRAPKGVERNLVRTIPVILREPLGDSPHEQVQFGLRLILRDTRAKLSEHVQPENAAIIGTVKTPNITIHRDRNPQFGAKPGCTASEIPRGYPNNGVGMAIDLNRFADDLRITREMVLPDGVTDD